ncbi:disease resistance protein RGA2-like [Pistacia vera]|uniref:disease resistance protein RGA2-like n=1 Tax=Pistacia vera TaxID=55513 RepID=UPI001263DF8E|nr:disease resistance protein RGA2-like [Pistacia vera]
MAEALVSTVLEQLASIGCQQAEEGMRLIAGAKQEVEKLQSNFVAIQDVLIDAENRQVKENAVRFWLAKLKDVSYDIDDVLDEWYTKLQILRIKKDEDASKPLKKVRSFILHCLGCRPLILRHDIAVQIKDLDRKLDIISTEKERFHFRSITESSKELERPMTTSVIDLTEIFGRDNDKNTIIDFLLTQSSHTQDLHIISIVGMGGIGKTTLAQLVFNDDQVNTYFEEKIWVCVSEHFDELRVAKAILESLNNDAPSLNELETVVRNIRQHIDGRKFLLVLDDIWTENPKHWDQLKHSLKCGSLESRILVTTRKESTANAIGTTKIIPLGTLSEEKCWSLFSKIAFSRKSNEESNELVEIGREIVKKCKGLPLAVKTLASLLCFKRKFVEWKNILESEIWELEEVEQEVFRPLLLSYYDLSPTLKKCFSYCAIFPKDYEIEKEKLIRLWMAQGYVKSKPNKDMELIGEEYFETLAMRSFFQDFKQYDNDIDIFSCKMHDIVHDFAKFLTQNECYTIEVDDMREIKLESSYHKVRHSMIMIHGKASSFRWLYGGIEREVSFPSSIYTGNTFLRSLVVDVNSIDYHKIFLSKLVDQMTCLRSLCLKGCSINEIQVEIKKLIHLRCLNLSENRRLNEFPETLCGLYNLQTLLIGYYNIEKLPQGIGKLINLRHFSSWWTNTIYMPRSLERLTSLRTLEYFVISEGSYGSKACSVECLKAFNHLRKLGIKGFGNLREVDEVRGIELNNKKNLRDLYVGFEGRMNDEQNQELLEELQPHPNLEILRLRNYSGNTIFPNWMMSFTNFKKLFLWNCINCKHLPPLGKLSSLEILQIWKLKSVKRVDNEFLGIESDVTSSSTSIIAFPKLKYLDFEDMIELEEWNYEITKRGDEDIRVMPSLQTLKLYSCPKLKSLPNHLNQMTTLKKEIYGCPSLLSSLPNTDQEDIDLMVKLNFDAYRFSKLFEEGTGEVNQLGVDYYNRLIDYMVQKGITPYANLYHYDLPLALQEKYNGLLSCDFVKDYADYADFCFKTYGDRVKNWFTFNEPRVIAALGFDNGINPLSRCSKEAGNCTAGDSGTEPYIAAHHLILAHAAAVERYREKYQDKEQGGRTGILLDFVWYEPLTRSKKDRYAAERGMQFSLGWFLHPITYGEYPRIMQDIVGDRLPKFTEAEVQMVKGSIDLVGINVYTGFYMMDPPWPKSNITSYQNDWNRNGKF